MLFALRRPPRALRSRTLRAVRERPASPPATLTDARYAQRLAELRARGEQADDINTTLRARSGERSVEDLPVSASTDEDLGSDLPTLSLAPEAQEATKDSRGAAADLETIAVLGEGGMGRVVLAKQRSLRRDVAVKMLHADGTDADAAALVREARVAGVLEHPAIVPIHALGADARGRPLLVMKRIEGVSWSAMLADGAHPSWERRGGDRLAANLEILTQVCHALELAHSRGIIHRDLKPSNVMVGTFGDVYLVDWGLAARAGSGAHELGLVGTPGYFAPEMALGQNVDARSDVYLLGATLHRVLTGRPRHDAADFYSAIDSAMRSASFEYAPDVPPQLATLCNEATARDPAARPQSARAFRERLAAFLRSRSALSICAAATRSLTSLESLLAAAPAGATLRDPVAAYRLGSEARFGLRESLHIFPEGEEAKGAMRRCLVALVDLELRGGHIEAAEALLRELSPPDPLLAERVDAARREAAARLAETERLRRLVRERDPGTSLRARVGLTVVLLAIAAGIPFLSSVGRADDDAPRRLVIAVMLAIGGTLTATVVLRRRFETLSHRGVVGVVLGTEVLVLVDRLLGLMASRPISLTLRNDLLLMAAVQVTLGALTFPRAWLGALLAIGGAFAIERAPAQALPIYGASLLTVVVSFVWAISIRPESSRARGRGRTADDPRSPPH